VTSAGGSDPLGRYGAGTAAPGVPVPAVPVALLGVPVRLLVRAREHHDDLMREFRLLALDGAATAAQAPARLADVIAVLGERYGAASARPDALVDAALEAGEPTVDLRYEVGPDVAQAALALDGLMREADTFCAAEQLMTLPRSPLLVDFAAWYVGEFVDQLSGAAPRPWTGPLDPPD